MRITLVKSWSHPDDTTDVDKHGVPLSSASSYLSQCYYIVTSRDFIPIINEAINVVAVFFSLARKIFRDKVLLQNFTRVLLSHVMHNRWLSRDFVHKTMNIKSFHSRGQCLCKFMGTREISHKNLKHRDGRLDVMWKRSFERFHSRGRHLCKCIRTKESVFIRKEFNSHRTCMEHEYGLRDVMWKRSIGWKHDELT